MATKNIDKELLEAYDRGELSSVFSSKDLKKYQKYAKATFAKDRRVNIRISSKVLEGLQLRAVEEGIPYQTLIASILHKFIQGRLTDSAPNKSLDLSPQKRRKSA